MFIFPEVQMHVCSHIFKFLEKYSYLVDKIKTEKRRKIFLMAQNTSN